MNGSSVVPGLPKRTGPPRFREFRAGRPRRVAHRSLLLARSDSFSATLYVRSLSCLLARTLGIHERLSLEPPDSYLMLSWISTIIVAGDTARSRDFSIPLKRDVAPTREVAAVTCSSILPRSRI